MNARLVAELAADIGSFTHDPLGYVLYNWPWGVKDGPLEKHSGPRKWQCRFLDRIGARLKAGALTPEAAIRMARSSGHGVGKSALVAMLTKWALDTFPKTRVVITANTDTQLRTKTWPEVAKWHAMSLTREWFTCTATALISNIPGEELNWRADAIPWSEHNTEAFQGLHNEGKRIVLVFDEASKIADKVWEAAEGAMTDKDTEIMWFVFGNGTRATGRFRECWRRFEHRWETEQIDAREVEGINIEEHLQWVRDYGEDSDFVKVRVRGLFPSVGLRSLISDDDVNAAWGRKVTESAVQAAPTILTCDPAWEGVDLLTIGMRKGLYYAILHVQPKNDNDVEVAQHLARLEEEHHADAVFVDAGYGTGIVSVGRTWGRHWRLVWSAGKSNDPGCLNKRAEMAVKTRDWLRAGGSLPTSHPRLREDLTGVELLPRLDDKIQLESKEQMKKRGLPSPDFFDNLALSFAEPVAKLPPGTPIAGSRDTGQRQEYDPHRDYERLG